jgi:hypothetical protein
MEKITKKKRMFLWVPFEEETGASGAACWGTASKGSWLQENVGLLMFGA